KTAHARQSYDEAGYEESRPFRSPKIRINLACHALSVPRQAQAPVKSYVSRKLAVKRKPPVTHGVLMTPASCNLATLAKKWPSWAWFITWHVRVRSRVCVTQRNAIH